MSDLTWEQKERVLRYLFARMNNSSVGPKKISSAPSLPSLDGKVQRLTFSHSQDDSEYVLFVCFFNSVLRPFQEY